MNTIFLPKAAKILDRPEIPETESLTICINRPIEETASLELHQEYFQEQADILCDALVSTLPQGIVWRLMIRLMERESKNLLGSFKGGVA